MFAPGDRVGAYQVIRLLGAGGMGEVFLAQHRHLGRRAAVKVLLPEVTSIPEALTRFMAEARAAAVIHHPGIVEVFDCDVLPDGRAYIVMEYLTGESLRATLDRAGQLGSNLPFAAALLGQAADALQAAHDKGIVHRDLKPDNIFLTHGEPGAGEVQVKLLDFGIAKLLEHADSGGAKTRTGVILGTPRYMSPEQCRGSTQIDRRSDVYSLGCVAFEMFTGQVPFDRVGVGDTLIAHAVEPPPPVRSRAPELPDALADLVDQCLRKDPAERPQSMDAIAQVMAGFLGCRVAHFGASLRRPDGFPDATQDADAPVAIVNPTPPVSLARAQAVSTTPLPPGLRAGSPSGAMAPALTPTGTRRLSDTTFGTAAAQIKTGENFSSRKKLLWFALPALLSAVVLVAVFSRGSQNAEPVAPTGTPIRPPAAQPVKETSPAAPGAARPVKARVRFVSLPPGAAVWIDGDTRPRGTTPIELTVPVGTALEGRLEAPGRVEKRFAIRADADREAHFELSAAPPAPTRAPTERPASKRPPKKPASDDPYKPVGD